MAGSQKLIFRSSKRAGTLNNIYGTGRYCQVKSSLADYRFTLTQTFADSLYGSTEALDLSFPEWMGGMLNTATLYQQSWNPNFGTETFDQFAEGTYNLVLKLKPIGRGAPLIAHARVIVSDCP